MPKTRELKNIIIKMRELKVKIHVKIQIKNIFSPLKYMVWALALFQQKINKYGVSILKSELKHAILKKLEKHEKVKGYKGKFC
jgi:hypothetical protein